MASIGAQSFISLAGPLERRARVLANISDPWEDGVCYQQLARRAEPGEHEAIVDVPTMGVAVGLMSAYADMVGSIVTVVQYGSSFPSYLVEAARVVDVIEGIIGVGGLTNGRIQVISRWRLQYVGQS